MADIARFAAPILVAALLAPASAQEEAEPPAPEAPAPLVLDGKAVRKLATEVERLAVSPDGRWLAAGGDDGEVALFATTGPERRDAGKVARYVDALVFSADSAWILAAPMEDDGKQVLLAADVATGAVRREFDVSDPERPGVERMDLDRFSQAVPVPGGAHVELLRRKTVELWDLATGERVERRKNDGPWVQAKVRSADGSLVAINGTGPLRVVDGATGAARFQFASDEGGVKGNVLIGSHSTTPIGFATSAGILLLRDTWDETKDPKTLTADNIDKRTKEFRKILGISTRDGKRVWTRDLPRYVYDEDVIVGADVAAVPSEGKIEFVNCVNGQLRERAPTSKKWTCAAVSPDGLTFWGGAEDGSIVLLKTFPAPKGK